jgi:hypothetical protein
MANELVPVVEAEIVIQDYEALLNVTWNGQNGDLLDPIAYDASDDDIKVWAQEAIAAGSIPGIAAGVANFDDFVVDRFAASREVPHNRVFVRPKTPFGGGLFATKREPRPIHPSDRELVLLNMVILKSVYKHSYEPSELLNIVQDLMEEVDQHIIPVDEQADVDA